MAIKSSFKCSIESFNKCCFDIWTVCEEMSDSILFKDSLNVFVEKLFSLIRLDSLGYLFRGEVFEYVSKCCGNLFASLVLERSHMCESCEHIEHRQPKFSSFVLFCKSPHIGQICLPL